MSGESLLFDVIVSINSLRSSLGVHSPIVNSGCVISIKR